MATNMLQRPLESSRSISSAQSEFKNLEEQARVWLTVFVGNESDPHTSLGKSLADGEVLMSVAKKMVEECSDIELPRKESEGTDAGNTLSRKSTGRKIIDSSLSVSRESWKARSNVHAFLQVCRLFDLNDIHLCTPSDVVDGKNLRKVYLCLRALSKRAREIGVMVPDFDTGNWESSNFTPLPTSLVHKETPQVVEAISDLQPEGLVGNSFTSEGNTGGDPEAEGGEDSEEGKSTRGSPEDCGSGPAGNAVSAEEGTKRSTGEEGDLVKLEEVTGDNVEALVDKLVVEVKAFSELLTEVEPWLDHVRSAEGILLMAQSVRSELMKEAESVRKKLEIIESKLSDEGNGRETNPLLRLLASAGSLRKPRALRWASEEERKNDASKQQLRQALKDVTTPPASSEEAQTALGLVQAPRGGRELLRLV